MKNSMQISGEKKSDRPPARIDLYDYAMGNIKIVTTRNFSRFSVKSKEKSRLIHKIWARLSRLNSNSADRFSHFIEIFMILRVFRPDNFINLIHGSGLDGL